MKKMFILAAMVVALISCGNDNNASGENAAGTDTATTGAATPTADLSTNPDYTRGLQLVAQSDCLGCHKVAEKLVGPAYTEVAARYAGQPGAADSLANKIIYGGAGNWGEVAMTAHQNISKEDAVAMAKYILLLKQPQ